MTTNGWSLTAAPAIPKGDKIFCKVVASDGEYVVSYVFEHKSIDSKGKLIFEVDDWLADMWIAPNGTIYCPGEDLIHYRSRGTWRSTDLPTESVLSSVWGLANDDVYAVGKGCILRLTGNAWTYLWRGSKRYVDRIAGRENDLYAVGRRGLVVHYDGQSWRVVDFPTNENLNAITIVNGDVWIVGAHGIVSRGDKDRWLLLEFEEVDFLDVIPHRGEVYIAGGEDGLFRVDGEDLIVERDDVVAGRLASDGSTLYVSGGSTISSFDGKKWKEYTYRISF